MSYGSGSAVVVGVSVVVAVVVSASVVVSTCLRNLGTLCNTEEDWKPD